MISYEFPNIVNHPQVMAKLFLVKCILLLSGFFLLFRNQCKRNTLTFVYSPKYRLF